MRTNSVGLFAFSSSSFPYELYLKIFNNLRFSDLPTIRRVCTFWEKIAITLQSDWLKNHFSSPGFTSEVAVNLQLMIAPSIVGLCKVTKSFFAKDGEFDFKVMQLVFRKSLIDRNDSYAFFFKYYKSIDNSSDIDFFKCFLKENNSPIEENILKKIKLAFADTVNNKSSSMIVICEEFDSNTFINEYKIPINVIIKKAENLSKRIFSIGKSLNSQLLQEVYNQLIDNDLKKNESRATFQKLPKFFDITDEDGKSKLSTLVFQL